MPSPDKRSISVSAIGYDEIRQAARARGVSASAFVDEVIKRYTPAPRVDPLPESMRCTGCKRATLHRIAFAGAEHTRWKCLECGRSKLAETRSREAA